MKFTRKGYGQLRRAVWALHAVTRAKPLDGARKAADAYLQELGT